MAARAASAFGLLLAWADAVAGHRAADDDLDGEVAAVVGAFRLDGAVDGRRVAFRLHAFLQQRLVVVDQVGRGGFRACP